MGLRLTLVPGEGALPLRLGMTRDEIEVEMSKLGVVRGPQRGAIDYYFDNAVQIEFKDDGTASFIGISSHEEIELFYRGQRISHLPAREVHRLMAEPEGESAPPFDTYDALFPRQILTLWDADRQYDRRGERVVTWAQVGIGNADYLAAVGKYSR